MQTETISGRNSSIMRPQTSYARDAVAVRGLLGLGQGVIEHADHFYGRGQLQPSGDVTDVGDHASADDGYFV